MPLFTGQVDSGPRLVVTATDRTVRLASPSHHVFQLGVMHLQKLKLSSFSHLCHKEAAVRESLFVSTSILKVLFTVWYDISLVDGYSLPVQIVPNHQEGSCRTTDCNLHLNSCPRAENDVGDLQVSKNGQPIMCLSPCKRFNYPKPIGLGRNEQEDPGKYLCCPTPPISSEQCRAGIVVQTQYVKLVHRDCPTAYAYAYDDAGGLHTCPTDTSFDVTFCHI